MSYVLLMLVSVLSICSTSNLHYTAAAVHDHMPTASC